jgi:excisionase family DNA binding protein
MVVYSLQYQNCGGEKMPKPAITVPRTYSVRDVADMTGKHAITIYKAAERGAIPSRMYGRSRRFTEGDVDEILSKGWKTSAKATT